MSSQAKRRSEYATICKELCAGLAEISPSKPICVRLSFGIIAYFNAHYVKTEIFDREISKAVSTAYRLREKSDYQDFYIVTQDEAVAQMEKAKRVISAISNYLFDKWSTL